MVSAALSSEAPGPGAQLSMSEQSDQESNHDEGPTPSSDDDLPCVKLPAGQQTLQWGSQARAALPTGDRVLTGNAEEIQQPVLEVLEQMHAGSEAGGLPGEAASASGCVPVAANMAFSKPVVADEWDVSSSASSSTSSVSAPAAPRSTSRSRSPRRGCIADDKMASTEPVLAGCGRFALPAGPQVGILAEPPPQPTLPAGMAWWQTPVWNALLPHRMKQGDPQGPIFLESLCSGTASELLTAQVPLEYSDL